MNPATAPGAHWLERDASLELNRHERVEFDASSRYLRPGTRIYVSHLPGQRFSDTLAVCERVAAAGLDPVPHLPVRLLEHREQLKALLRDCRHAGVREPLLLAGDYPQPRGPYAAVIDALRTGALQELAFTRLSLAGHPEGHPAVPTRDIRQAQIDKWRLAAGAGLQVTFVTQFFFEARPFVDWASDLRAAGVQARLVAGLAGPAGIGKLLRLARRCGVGPSLRALTSRPEAMLKLMRDHQPDALLHSLAAEQQRRTGLFDGIHLFSFGGFSRTVDWLNRSAIAAARAG